MSVADYEVGRSPGAPTRDRVEVDPITMRVLGGAFHASPTRWPASCSGCRTRSIIRESEDLGAGLFDAEGRELCESDSTPMHIGSLPWYIRGFLERLRGRSRRATSSSTTTRTSGRRTAPTSRWRCRSSHEGELLGFAAVTAHVLDVGGSYPGINADAFDVYAEAKLYNALRWYQEGELNVDVDRMIFDNVRTETMNRGDMKAMMAACNLGRDRFLRLTQRYGVETMMSAAYGWMDYSEKMLREQIAKIPDGEYTAPTAWLDDDARNRGVRLRVETKVIVEGDGITIDLTGSAAEVPTGYNVPFEGSLLVGAYYAVRTLLLDEIDVPRVACPQNDGDLPGGEGDRAEGDDLQPQLPARVLLALLPGAARRGQHDPGARGHAAAAGDRGQLGGHPLLLVLRVRAGDRRVLALPRGQRGLLRRPVRQGRHGLRRQPHGQHAQQPDRGARPALPGALRPVRAAPGAGGAGQVARRDRDHPAQPLPRRRDVLVRGRPAVRPAARHLRRLERARRLDAQEPRHRRARSTSRRR